MPDANTLLEAGGLIPVKKKVANNQHVDAVSARVYRHGALGDRPVVRLSADNLAQGDDLEMEFLGFQAPEVLGPLAYRRRQALGFPGWALIHDPDHARYALELVKEFKKAARKSRSKPGHGYDAFVEIAKRLNKSVAHFLPSFWEQVGREFIQIGNTTYASRAFGKAREAERVHALTVDEKLRQDAFLEFALAGCLSNKSLTEYGKELQQSMTGEDAWKFFRELCVRRTLGGMPPWASMPNDLKPLIAGAKLDVNQELTTFLTEILESPAMNRANMGFWKACSTLIGELAATNDRVAGILLNLLPETSRWDRKDVWAWFEFLDQWNVLPNAWKKDVAPEAAPQGGPAVWFSRLAAISDEPPQRLFDLLECMADRLKQDGEPIQLAVKGWRDWSINIDLLDLALEKKLQIADLPEDVDFDLTNWAKPSDDAKNRPRDPLFVHQDERYRKLLEDAVPQAAGQPEFEAAAKGKTALASARKNWLLGLIDQMAQGGLPSVEISLNHLENKTSRETYREFPEAYGQLKSIDLAPVLGRTLAGGVLDEYGWPIAEEIADRLNPKGKQELRTFGAFPYLILTDGLKAIVVNHEKVVLEHELRLPKNAKLDELFFLDGQLCVYYETNRYDDCFYWSSDPKKVTKHWHYSRDAVKGAVIDLANGGTFNGQKTVHAGTTDPPNAPNPFAYDGEHFWQIEWRDAGQSFREVNPSDGKSGRWSLPSFFEDFLTTGAELQIEFCLLLALGDAVKNSPLGSRNGQIGWRVRKTSTGTIECEGIDGRTWQGQLALQTPAALADQPGTSERWPITGTNGWELSYGGCHLWDPSGSYEIAFWTSELGAYNRGQVAGFPPIFWHALKVRDVNTSKKLRGTTEAQAKTLLAAVAKDLKAREDDEDEQPPLTQTLAAVKKWISGLKHERLQTGVLGVIEKAGELRGRLANLIESRDPKGASPLTANLEWEVLVKPAMEVLNINTGWGETAPLFPHLTDVAAFYAGEKKKNALVAAPFDWWELLDNLPGRVWAAYWQADESNDAWLKFLERWADLPFQDLPGRFRVMEGTFDGPAPVTYKPKDNEDVWLGHVYQGNYYVMQLSPWDDDWKILECAPTGKFHLLPKFQVQSEEELRQTWSSEILREFVTEARSRPKPFLEKEQLQALADQLGISPAEVGLVWFGFPKIDSWEKNFLPKPLREQLNVKVAEAEAARQSLRSLPVEARQRLLAALLDGPPAELWEHNGKAAIERLLAAWETIVPKRLTLPPKVQDQLTEAFPYQVDKGKALVALAAPKTHSLLSADAEWKYFKGKDSYRVELYTDQRGETFDSGMLSASVISVAYLAYHLPVGDPARQLLPAVHQAGLKCLKSQKLLLDFLSRWVYEEKDENAGKTLLEKTFGKTKKFNEGWLVDDGLIVGYAEGYQTQLAIRPAKLKTEKDVERLNHIAQMMYDDEETDISGVQGLVYLNLMRSPGYEAICERIKKTPVPVGQHETNPDLSAPELVAKVEKQHQLGHEAAMLYLQLLTLHDPTTANVKTWNNWTTAQYNNAVKELTKNKLVLEAKRARAGRNHFLPGGWEALKIPHLPIETWKLPLFEITRGPDGRLNVPLPRILPLKPVHELFQQAWQRTQSGDEPRYEEVS